MARLTANTLVTHPETGAPVLLAAGGDVPDWAASLVGAHLIEGGAAEGSQPEQTPDASAKGQDGPPPKGGAGSGAPAWRAYAAKKGVEVAEDASREDVVAALEAAGVPTE